MKKANVIKRSLIFFMWLILVPLASRAEEKLPDPETYVPKFDKMGKELYDDPTDLFVSRPYKDILPPEVYDKVTFDQEKMKNEGAELNGFTAPELVGKIAPEIKPGKYTYKDLEKFPGLKELLPKELQRFFKPGGPPFVCNIPEFEIIPTRQFYFSLPAIEATKRNLGKAKLDKDGYIVQGSWEGGMPFPRPSGEFKAQQVFYNFFVRSNAFNMCWAIPNESNGYGRNLKMDSRAVVDVAKISWKGRILFPPYGWFSERAQKNNEWCSYGYIMYDPRAQRGTILLRMLYEDPEKMDTALVYVPSLRRIRKLTATDTQDPTADMTYDDQNMLLQKISPNRYPYKYEIIEEREYLLPYGYGSVPVWVDSKNSYAMRGVTLMRRPTYVLQMTQMDPHYVYSKRILYVDKETFSVQVSASFDQKGQLYRSQFMNYVFFPEYGMVCAYGTLAVQFDHIDNHATAQAIFTLPGIFLREDFTIQEMIKRGK